MRWYRSEFTQIIRIMESSASEAFPLSTICLLSTYYRWRCFYRDIFNLFQLMVGPHQIKTLLSWMDVSLLNAVDVRQRWPIYPTRLVLGREWKMYLLNYLLFNYLLHTVPGTKDILWTLKYNTFFFPQKLNSWSSLSYHVKNLFTLNGIRRWRIYLFKRKTCKVDRSAWFLDTGLFFLSRMWMSPCLS